MESDADAEFLKSMAENDLGRVEKLPKKCQASHVFVMSGSVRVLPILFYNEPKCKVWTLGRS